ncbi:hypothetical protein [Actinomadura sp. NPDC000600]|uniref:hypothetical protein n=1 Tax=Actinomadura sp. NPDC000600 TaxID=3154262 RepID=UPI00339812BD
MTSMEDFTISGDGAQNVIGNTVSRDLIVQQLVEVHKRRSMMLGEADVDERVAGYVRARNHDQIVTVLGRHHAIGLAGPPGAGVSTTAIAALRELRPGMPVHLFSPEEDDVEEGPSAQLGYLVRGTDDDEKRLWSCKERIERAGGFLLVVGNETELRRFAGFLPIVQVEPPPADLVYRSRLHRAGLGGTRWPAWSRTAELLRGALPGDARRLADLVIEIGEEGEVERAYRGWKDQLCGWFAEHPGLRDQTLLIAAAAIGPADETSVYGAAMSLARHLEINVEGGGLAWCPSTGLSELLGADRADDRIVFRRHGYASSVLRHVCDDYPLVRMDLLEWLSALPSDTVLALDPGRRQKLVEVFADLAAESGAAAKIVQVAGGWASDGKADLAYVALARTCLDPLVGGRVRRGLYEWANNRNAPQTLKLTVARVCQVVGESYATVALTRLKHLATYGNEQVRDEVLDVVRTLAEANRREVVRAAAAWCGSSVPLRVEADAERRARTGLRVLLDLLPDAPARDTWLWNITLGAVDRLARQGGERLRAAALGAARELAAHDRRAMLDLTLAWARNADGSPPREAEVRAQLATALFLDLAAERDTAGLAAVLTASAAVPAQACVPPWSVAMAAELRTGTGFGRFPEVAMLWLETAAARPALRPGIVSLFAMVAGGDPARRTLLTDLVRTWAGTRRARRTTKEDLLVHLLQPEWQRLLYKLWVKARRAVAGGG